MTTLPGTNTPKSTGNAFEWRGPSALTADCYTQCYRHWLTHKAMPWDAWRAAWDALYGSKTRVTGNPASTRRRVVRAAKLTPLTQSRHLGAYSKAEAA